MVETLPKDYFLREHNPEFYVNEKIHQTLHFLDFLPMVNNEYGEFTQYITDANADEVTENPRGVGEGACIDGVPLQRAGRVAVRVRP